MIESLYNLCSDFYAWYYSFDTLCCIRYNAYIAFFSL